MDGNGLVIETKGLTKRYGSRAAVDGLDLEVARGEIFGFLGPNGAGKTTTIRMLLGLLEPDAGEVRILGRQLRRARGEVLPLIGALVEMPAFHPYLSGRDNLRALCRVLGLEDGAADSVLDLVGLGADGRRRYSTYSLGMKQRLGVAAALLGDPRLLILDEPANGLDPIGIIEMRDLLRRLARSGITVFLSSHILGEVSLLCDRVAIIREGRLVLVERVDDLLRRETVFVLDTPDPEAAERVLAGLSYVKRIWREEDRRVMVEAPGVSGNGIVRPLVQASVAVDGLRRREASLEEIFLTTVQEAEVSS